MTSEIATRDAAADALSDAQILQYLGLSLQDPRARAAILVAQRYRLDPLLKHIVVIPRGGVYITRDGLLHIAHRSGQLDGIVLEDGPTLVDGEWRARVSVYRKDMRHPFTYTGRYPVRGANAAYAPEMAIKAAEAHALRRAFSVTGAPVLEEQRPEPESARRVTAAEIVGEPAQTGEEDA